MNQSNCAADVIRNRINCTFNIYNSAFHSFEINSIEGCFPTHRIFKKYQLIILCCIFRIVFFFRTTRKRKVLFSLIINAFYAANQLFCFLNAVFCTTMLTLKHVVFFDNIRTAAQFTNHCLHGISSPLSLILFFHFTPPPKKVKCFLAELYISGISNKSTSNCCASSQELSSCVFPYSIDTPFSLELPVPNFPLPASKERPPAFPLTSAFYFYTIFKFAAQDFTPAGNLTAPPPASAAAPACGHPPRPPAWASLTVPPHTADSAS